MAKRSDLPGVSSIILDGGLQVVPPNEDRNNSILIVGTAEDGPMYEPIAVNNKEETLVAFGRFGRGNLVRGIFEAFDASDGTPDIRAMRIGGGTKAYLDISEKSGSTINSPTTGWKALRLEARFPGRIYNSISIGIDQATRNIIIYNPKTDTYSSFSYDILNPTNPNVDARNVLELANAINADPNLNGILVASVSGIPAAYELYVNSNSTGITSDGVTTRIRLKDVLENYTTSTLGDVIGAGSGWFLTNPQVASTAGNWIAELQSVYSVTISEPYKLETAGLGAVKLKYTPLDGKNDSRTSTIQALEDYNLDENWSHNPDNATVVSEYVQTIVKQHIDQWPSTSGGYNNLGYLTFQSFACPDDSEAGYALADGTFYTDSPGVSGIASGYIFSNSGTLYADYINSASGWITATTKYMVNYDGEIIASGTPIIQVSDVASDDDAYWTTIPYDHTSGAYIHSWDSSTKIGIIGFGPNASGTTTAGLLDTSGIIKKDKYVRMSFNTVKGFLTEATTLAELETNVTDWTTYFVVGDEIKFSNAVPTDIIINQGVNIEFEPGTDVSITDSEDGEISFNNRSLQPGPGGRVLDATNKSIIGLQYLYLPQFPDISTSFASLNHGTDGTEVSNAKLYKELAIGYENLKNYEVDIIVPMGAYLDSVKVGNNSITGLRESVNSQFHIQLGDFLEAVSTNVNETIGIIGVESPTDVSVSTINNWVDKLTIRNLSDPLRGANIIPLFDNYRVNVVAFEPYFTNVGGISYFANGAAAYAGMISSFPPHVAPTNKPIKNVFRTRFNLSDAQLTRLMNERYVTMKKRPGRNPVITDSMTLAAHGSDYVRLSTVRIVFAVMDLIREICDPFIGQPNTLEHRNAMDQSISRGLQALSDEGALRAYNFNLISTSNMQVLGDIDIEIILVPVFEIRRIRAIIKLRKSLPVNV